MIADILQFMLIIPYDLIYFMFETVYFMGKMVEFDLLPSTLMEKLENYQNHPLSQHIVLHKFQSIMDLTRIAYHFIYLNSFIGWQTPQTSSLCLNQLRKPWFEWNSAVDLLKLYIFLSNS